MIDEIVKVREFHEKMGVSAEQPLDQTLSLTLCEAGMECAAWAEELEQLVGNNDKRYLRAHLLLEELGEFLIAIGHGNEIEAVDGLADLLYVLLGTAVTFNWPLQTVFDEVHRSNMTKEKQPDDPSAERVRQKGPNYEPPRIDRIMADHRREW